MWRDGEKSDMLKIAKRMFKTNQNITRNGDGVLGVSDEDKKLAQKSYYERLLNTKFVWDSNLQGSSKNLIRHKENRT